MGKQRSEVRIDMGHSAKPFEKPVPAEPGAPFRILVLGDFSGRASRGVCEPDDLATRKLHRVDRDDFDELIERLGTEVRVPLGDTGTITTDVKFRELDDFHPDELYRRADVFDKLRDLRAQLLDPSTSADVIAKMDTAEPTPDPEPETDDPDAQARADLGASLLDSALQATPQDAGESSLVDRLVRELVTPHRIPRPDPRQADFVEDVDRSISEQMRALLRAPTFQALEATWRGLYLLVRRLDTDRTLQLHVLDVSRPELEACFEGDARGGGLAKQLVERTVETPGGEPFAVIVGAYTFAPTASDAALLSALGHVAARAGAPFVADGSPEFAGCEDFGTSPDPDDWTLELPEDDLSAWSDMRELPAAAFTALATPRYLVRMPYGPKTSPTTCFSFEEESVDPRHEELLWGNSAFTVALALAQTWRESGWQLRPGQRDEVDGLPVHIRTVDGSPEAVPCAEIELTSRGAERIGENGLIPVFSVRGTDAIRFGSVRSMSSTSEALAGRWS